MEFYVHIALINQGFFYLNLSIIEEISELFIMMMLIVFSFVISSKVVNRFKQFGYSIFLKKY